METQRALELVVVKNCSVQKARQDRLLTGRAAGLFTNTIPDWVAIGLMRLSTPSSLTAIASNPRRLSPCAVVLCGLCPLISWCAASGSLQGYRSRLSVAHGSSDLAWRVAAGRNLHFNRAWLPVARRHRFESATSLCCALVVLALKKRHRRWWVGRQITRPGRPISSAAIANSRIIDSPIAAQLEGAA